MDPECARCVRLRALGIEEGRGNDVLLDFTFSWSYPSHPPLPLPSSEQQLVSCDTERTWDVTCPDRADMGFYLSDTSCIEYEGDAIERSVDDVDDLDDLDGAGYDEIRGAEKLLATVRELV